MVDEDASQLASNCLSGIAQARGGSVATELVRFTFSIRLLFPKLTSVYFH